VSIIRPARHEDIPRLLELYAELIIVRPGVQQTKAPTSEEYARTLDQIQSTPGRRLLVIEENGIAAGMIDLLIMSNLSYNTRPWALIEALVIDSRRRREGLGKKLVEYALSSAREAGCYKIELTSNKVRLEAHAFYRSLGFQDMALGFRIYF
jgi:ribosomal protein S18 acetylase RimI-like enzyme